MGMWRNSTYWKPSDEQLQRGYRLAQFLGLAPELARSVIMLSTAGVEKLLAVQDKRNDHLAVRRNKFSLSEIHLFQRQILNLSGNQLHRGSTNSLSGFTFFLRRWLAFAVEWSMDSPFRTCVTHLRVVRSHPHAKALAAYELLLQNSDRVPGDERFRDAKKRILEAMLHHFPHELTLVEASRHEHKIASRSDPGGYVDEFKNALRQFAPWDIEPVRLEGRRHWELPEFAFHGSYSADESPIALRRTTQLVHPEGCASVLAAIGCNADDASIVVPLSKEDTHMDDNLRPNLGNLETLTAEEIRSIRTFVRKDSELTGNFKPDALCIWIDGRKRCEVPVSQEDTVIVDLQPEDHFLQIIGRDRERESVLGLHFLTRTEVGHLEPELLTLDLGGKQRFSLNIDPTNATISVSIERPNLGFTGRT